MSNGEETQISQKDLVISKAYAAFGEEESDELIEWLLNELMERVKVPWWVPERLVRRFLRKKLDDLLPEKLLELLYKFLDKIGVD